jgi:hypothetical protein
MNRLFEVAWGKFNQMIFKSSKNQMVLIEKLNNNKKNYL